MRKQTLIIAIFFFTQSIIAQAETRNFSSMGIDFAVEPIVGAEFSHTDSPNPHGQTSLIYGARVTAGKKNLALEVEYTRGHVGEAFLNPTQTINTDRENVKVGIRSEPSPFSFLSLLARAGAQASRQKIETIQNSQSTTQDIAWEIRPYAGAGLQLILSNKLSASAEVTYVFNSLKDFTQNNIQTTLALKVDLFKK